MNTPKDSAGTPTASANVLLVAKAPVAGRVKTRLAATVGGERSAELAAAAFLDSVRACVAAVGPARCRLALDGDLDTAVDGQRLTEALAGWTVLPQRGDGLAERLANAHLDVAGDGPVVQIGMDTPQVTAEHLSALVALLDEHDAVLADAEDGGWWALGLSDPRHGARLSDVAMSEPTTGTATRRTLERAGLGVVRGPRLRDVDTAEDAEVVAQQCASDSAFSRAWERLR
jgi:glycosyltransferase A (GT-A) superfamily protein (DUF2064 family)